MDYTPTSLETLFLWRLLASEGGTFLKDVKPDPQPAGRRRLEQAGLIASSKRRRPTSTGRGRPVTHLSLTEAGWRWAAEHLDAEVSGRSNAAGPILQSIMQKLKIHLADCPTSLADFIMGSTAAGCEDTNSLPTSELAAQVDPGDNDTTTQSNPATDHFSMIWEACRQLRRTTPSGAIHLAQLRDTLPNVSRERFNQVLLELERNERVVLCPFDNPRELESDDKNAALPNSAGFDRHILYLVEN